MSSTAQATAGQEATGDERSRWRSHLVLAAGVLLFFALLPAPGYQGDVEFWNRWLRQFQAGGFAALDANYPPLYLFWLRLVSLLYEALGAVPAAGTLLKFWAVLPAWVVQIALGSLLARRLREHGREPARSALFWLFAFNPALLMNAPIWGQVDILALAAIVPALLMMERRPHDPYWLPSLAVLAVLIKFQAVVFVPLLAGACLRDVRRALRGLVPAALLFLLAFAPFILADQFAAAFRRAYTQNLSLFPYQTMNAANFWYLLGGNMASYRTPLLDIAWLTPKRVGIAIFALVSLIVMRRAWRQPALDPFVAALLLMLVLFSFAPAMHERYLLMAVPLAAFAAASEPHRRGGWFVAATALCFLNMYLVLGLPTAATWMLTAAGTLTLLALVVWQWWGLGVPSAPLAWLERTVRDPVVLHGGLLAAAVVAATVVTAMR